MYLFPIAFFPIQVPWNVGVRENHAQFDVALEPLEVTYWQFKPDLMLILGSDFAI